jgi:hypothetical protein
MLRPFRKPNLTKLINTIALRQKNYGITARRPYCLSPKSRVSEIKSVEIFAAGELEV